MSIEFALLIASSLLFASVVLSKASGILGFPALLVFVGVGMLAGSEGPGGIAFHGFGVAQAIGVVALVLILFNGGVSTHWRDMRPVAWSGISLSTLGVLLTATLVALGAQLILKLSWQEALLLGAIASATDATAVFGILRSRNAGLKGRSQPLLEFESGSNDPMAIFLTIGIVSLVSHPEVPAIRLLPILGKQVLIGTALGYSGGRVLAVAINKVRLNYEGLYPVLTLSSVLLLYSITTLLGGSGFLAVYLAGLVLAQSSFIHKKTLVRFHDGIAWIMQIGTFLALGLLVLPPDLIPVAWEGTLLALWLIFIARPISVFISLALASLPTREKLMVSWVGLRGATPIILATFPFVAGIPGAKPIFDVVFFLVLVSVLVQGTTVPLVAKVLGMYASRASSGGPKIEFSHGESDRSRIVEIVVPHSSQVIGRQLVDLELPEGALIALVTREDRYFVPKGDSVLEGGDHLTIIADAERIDAVTKRLSG